MTHLLFNLGALAAAGVLVWLGASRRLRRRRGPPVKPAVARAMLARLAGGEDQTLTRYGHAITWNAAEDDTAYSGTAYSGTCGRCSGVVTVTLTEIEYFPPLADDERLLTCAGGGTG